MTGPRRRLVFATTNEGKVKELALLVGDAFEVLGQGSVGPVLEVVEDAPDFEGNAEKKALAFAAATGELSLADDSGLCVDALYGAPGVQSARYAPTVGQRNQKLLAALANVPDAQRTARFVCALCLASPAGVVGRARGTCEGVITRAERGAGGFGYDPLFALPDGRTMAELSAAEKSAVSHRGAAFRALLPTLLAQR